MLLRDSGVPERLRHFREQACRPLRGCHGVSWNTKTPPPSPAVTGSVLMGRWLDAASMRHFSTKRKRVLFARRPGSLRADVWLHSFKSYQHQGRGGDIG